MKEIKENLKPQRDQQTKDHKNYEQNKKTNETLEHLQACKNIKQEIKKGLFGTQK